MIIITITAIAKCSITCLSLFSLEFRNREVITIKVNPQTMSIMIAVCSEKNRTGIAKVRAKMNFEAKVDNVASHTFFLDFLVVSCETWMPMASENASAIAMLSIPPIITSLECVLENKPIIRPRVVITAEVNPKPRPIL